MQTRQAGAARELAAASAHAHTLSQQLKEARQLRVPPGGGEGGGAAETGEPASNASNAVCKHSRGGGGGTGERARSPHKDGHTRTQQGGTHTPHTTQSEFARATRPPQKETREVLLEEIERLTHERGALLARLAACDSRADTHAAELTAVANLEIARLASECGELRAQVLSLLDLLVQSTSTDAAGGARSLARRWQTRLLMGNARTNSRQSWRVCVQTGSASATSSRCRELR